VKGKVFSLIALVLVLGLLAGCAPAATPTPAPRVPGKVTSAADATWPPFEYVDEETKDLIGFDIDLVKAIAEEAGFEVTFINAGWDTLLAGMATGQYYMAASAMTITEERAKQFDFSDPYYNAGQLIAVAEGNTSINGPDDLPGKTVGAQLGTTGAMEVEAISGATLKNYDDIAQAFLDLGNGQIDAVVADNPLVASYVAKYAGQLKSVGTPFTDENYGIAVRKGEPELLAAINKALQTLKDQGFLDELENKWIRVAPAE
jgi:polar amino acid transport system substrate-binding protein